MSGERWWSARSSCALAAKIMLSSSIAGQRESIAADFTRQKQCRFQRGLPLACAPV